LHRKALPSIINTAFKILDPTPETRSLKLGNLEVLINAVLYNATAALHIMQNQDSNKLQLFFKQWFELLKDDLYLPRVHDKKLSILAMSALLTVDASQVPPTLQDGWTGIVNGILLTFKSLPAAISSTPCSILL
jgi:importin-7